MSRTVAIKLVPRVARVLSTDRWEQPTKPYLKRDLENMYPKADMRKMLFQKCIAPNGTVEEVVLVSSGEDAKIVLFAEVSSEIVEHKLIGSHQLRSAQGSEHWTAVQQEARWVAAKTTGPQRGFLIGRSCV